MCGAHCFGALFQFPLVFILLSCCFCYFKKHGTAIVTAIVIESKKTRRRDSNETSKCNHKAL